ncbi:hypothetical protein N7G274_001309 [Stereocaulon virgatum]|uniref:Uncharacterized protein n=1 Tax=Stereocaulon virgatum TaxID=373712 RepID=A0ABR4AP23_9LECA
MVCALGDKKSWRYCYFTALPITAPISTKPTPHHPRPGLGFHPHPEKSAGRIAGQREPTFQPFLDHLPHYPINHPKRNNAFHRLSATQFPPPQNHQLILSHLFLNNNDACLDNFYLAIDTAPSTYPITNRAHLGFYLILIETTSPLHYISKEPQRPLKPIINGRFDLVRLSLPLFLLFLQLAQAIPVTEAR